ncbi:MAG: molybdopterin-guanine dinucleotide biosynthesis protein B, partial [Candidatus Saliniplasma sp.]
MVIPHIAVVGKSETGKTSLVVELVQKLKENGYIVATVKHTKGDFSIDSKGTDTFKHAEAGSKLVVFSTPSETSFMMKRSMDIREILNQVKNSGDFDLMIIEGMKEENIPKISTDKDIEGDIYFEGDIEKILN